MQSKVAVPVLCALLGGAATAGTFVATGLVAPGSRAPAVQTALPLMASGAVGGTAVGAVYRRAAGGVVSVTARTVPVAASAFDVGMRRSDGVATGSGWVLDERGHVVTVAHLVRAAGEVQVELGGRRLQAHVLGLDEASDLAVLQVDPNGVDLTPLPLGDSDAVQVGDPVVAMGNRGGLPAPALAAGTISARQPRVTGPDGAVLTRALQTDARLPEGDCGGPLLDAEGRVIGVITRMAVGDGSHAVDLAVPANTAREVLPRLSVSTMKVVGG